MAVKRLKLNYDGFRRLRKEFDDELMRRADKVVDKCNGELDAEDRPGYKAEHSPSKNRARVTVFPDTEVASAVEAEENNLLKHFNAAR